MRNSSSDRVTRISTNYDRRKKKTVITLGSLANAKTISDIDHNAQNVYLALICIHISHSIFHNDDRGISLLYHVDVSMTLFIATKIIV